VTLTVIFLKVQESYHPISLM